MPLKKTLKVVPSAVAEGAFLGAVVRITEKRITLKRCAYEYSRGRKEEILKETKCYDAAKCSTCITNSHYTLGISSVW